MKIAVVTSGLLPVPSVKGGAIETLVDSLVEENEKNGKIDITIYSIYDKSAKQKYKLDKRKNSKCIYICNIPNLLIRIANKILKKNIPINKYYQKEVYSKLKKQEFDYIILENYPELVLKISKFSKIIPYIHSDVLNVNTPNAKEIINNSYKIITVSDYIKERVLEIGNIESERIITVLNSIDFKMLSDSEYKEQRIKTRQKYNISDNEIVYAYSGRISSEKGILELVKAFNKANVPNSKLMIIGGIWYNSKKRNNYLEQIENISGDNVIFTGYINHVDIQSVLCGIDIGVVPSICNEAAGLSVVEFMNTKNLVIGTKIGGISEYINKNDNILVDFSDDFIDNLAKAIRDSSNYNLDEIGEINYEYSKKFTNANNYENFINVLKESDNK